MNPLNNATSALPLSFDMLEAVHRLVYRKIGGVELRELSVKLAFALGGGAVNFRILPYAKHLIASAYAHGVVDANLLGDKIIVSSDRIVTDLALLGKFHAKTPLGFDQLRGDMILFMNHIIRLAAPDEVDGSPASFHVCLLAETVDEAVRDIGVLPFSGCDVFTSPGCYRITKVFADGVFQGNVVGARLCGHSSLVDRYASGEVDLWSLSVLDPVAANLVVEAEQAANQIGKILLGLPHTWRYNNDY